MTEFLKIEQALINSVVALSTGYPTEYPNSSLRSEDKGAVWIKASNLNGQSNVATLGSNGTDNNTGILQIDVNVLRDTGSGQLLAIIDQIASNYPAGKALHYGGENATISGTSVSPLRIVKGYARRSISISYYSRTSRS